MAQVIIFNLLVFWTYFRSREIALFLTESIPQFSFSAILAPVLPDSALGQDYTLE
jgi:hypothetical protein